MSDIVKRLRCTVPCADMTAKAGCHCAEAADTITALRAKVERLEEALNRAGCDHCSHWFNRAVITKGESNG